MPNLITSADFTGLNRLDTSNATVRTYIDTVIEQIQNELLALITYDETVPVQLADVKKMLLLFTYAIYSSKQTKINTSIGGVTLKPENSTIILNLDEEYDNYNKGVDIFNNYVTNVNDKKHYQNKFGI